MPSVQLFQHSLQYIAVYQDLRLFRLDRSPNKISNRGNLLLCDPVESDDIANCDEFFELNRYS